MQLHVCSTFLTQGPQVWFGACLVCLRLCCGTCTSRICFQQCAGGVAGSLYYQCVGRTICLSCCVTPCVLLWASVPGVLGQGQCWGHFLDPACHSAFLSWLGLIHTSMGCDDRSTVSGAGMLDMFRCPEVVTSIWWFQC